MNTIIDFFTPYVKEKDSKRLGNKYDGGYVVPTILLEKTEVLYTYGVGFDLSFEIDYLRNNKKVLHCYDHTVNLTLVKVIKIKEDLKKIFSSSPKWNQISFHKEGLSYEIIKPFGNFINHLEENEYKNERILLKIDIEGFEYDFFNKVDLSSYTENIEGILLELHNVRSNYLNGKLEKLINILKKNFFVYHFHPNNYEPLIYYPEIEIELPELIELTLVNKSNLSHFELNSDKISYTEFDFSNNPKKRSLKMKWLKYQTLSSSVAKRKRMQSLYIVLYHLFTRSFRILIYGTFKKIM